MIFIQVVPRGRYIFYSNSWRIKNISTSKMGRIYIMKNDTRKIIYLINMHKSNNTFFSIYGNRFFVKWKMFEKCAILLEKRELNKIINYL